MKITRRFTVAGKDVYSGVAVERRTSRISNPDGSIVFEMNDAEIPTAWSQLATDIMVSKYFRKAGVPQTDADGKPELDEAGKPIMGREKSAKQVIHRLAGCWRHWGESHGYFDSAEDAQAFYDELAHMLLHQMCAPNSPQWFNTGLNFAYGITGPAQGHYYCDPKSGQLIEGTDAYTHPQPHACFIQSVSDDLVNPGGIMDLWTREARLFKYGSGTGSNFSKVRGESEKLSGGGRSSGLMSFLRIGDRAAGAIKSGGTTRRAAKMVCLDLDHPDIEQFINWKVREELKVACLAEGIKHLPADQKALADSMELKLDYDFNGEAYYTVSGQNSNNSVRIPNEFFKAVEEDADWTLYNRTNGKPAKTIKARALWDQIAFAAWRCADPGVQYDGTINQWHTCPKSGRINASNPCVTGDTRVLTPGGIWRRIDQMIHLPARLITNLHEQEIHVTDGAFPTGTRDVYQLRTAGGYSLTLTADHRVWTKNRGWVEAQHLTTDDFLCLPSKPAAVQSIGEPQDARFFQLAGLFASEANTDLASLQLDRCTEGLDADAIDDFTSYVAEHWNENMYGDDHANQAMLSSNYGYDGATLTTAVTHRRLISRMKAFVYTEAGNRRLSDEAFTAGLPAQKHLLRGLFTTDGTITEKSIELRSYSPGLLHDVQLILLGFGVQSCYYQSELDGGAVEGGALSDRRVHPNALGPRALNSRGDAVDRRHGLRIEPASLRLFCKHVGLLPGRKRDDLIHTVAAAPLPPDRQHQRGNWDRFASLTHAGRRQVFDLTEPKTQSFIAGGITVHNCSEYMFLDDTACNLASLNVLKFFDADTKAFDIESFRHGVKLWTVVLEISVLMASFPSEEIATLSYKFRTLGLGYANLGAMLMQAGIAYDSEKGRAICAAISAILTGESYTTSAEMARELGAFPGFTENRADMLRVIRNHRRAAYDVQHHTDQRNSIGNYDSLTIHPVGIDASQFGAAEPLASPKMLDSARQCWDRALALGEQHGYRNAQTTVIAPTGTIGLLMDCDTTGVEPDFALVKFKKLAGGGYFKIANQSLRPSLVNLGYTADQIHEMLRYVMGTLTLHDAPHVNFSSLLALGFTRDELKKIEDSLPGQFEIGFAFSGWALGAAAMERFGIADSEWQAPGFNLLKKLGYTRKQIDAANDVICGRGTVENAPHFKPQHYSVFDCANKCGRHGTRFIHPDGHIRMMAAAQPFITGAISKTINLPNEATVADIKQSYQLSWELGLKSNALYRDGSKLSQPLNVKSDKDLDELEEDDELNIEAAREEITGVLTSGSDELGRIVSTSAALRSDNLEPSHTKVIEKIIERIVERPLRRRLPDTRNAITHKFDVAGHEGYITAGLYTDGQPGEVFITMAKEGSTVGGLMDSIATLVSVSLQYGVPVESLVRKFEHVRFEPAGMTRNPEIPMAKSLIDYIFRWLAMEFVPGYRAANAPHRPAKKPASDTTAPFSAGPSSGEQGRTAGRADESEEPFKIPGIHYDIDDPTPNPQPATPNAGGSSQLRMALLASPLSQQTTEMQSDAPACDVCGSITVRSGTCYKCLNCGNSMGCS